MYMKMGVANTHVYIYTHLQGMTELNGCEPKKVKILGPYTFSIGDTSSYSNYTRGGVVTQVKMPQKITFVSFIWRNHSIRTLP